MISFRRTHTCGELREKDAGQAVLLAGWVHRHRDLGSLIFIDIRDRFGITQIVVDPKILPQGHKLGFEDVIAVKGKVALRKDPNPHLPTGQIELLAQEIELLSEAAVLPFSLSDEQLDVHEELRLQYRYLDMRRGPILKNLILRHKAMMSIRQFLDGQGFVEGTSSW